MNVNVFVLFVFIILLVCFSQQAELEDVKKAYTLFYDQGRSQQYLDQFQALFSLELDADGDVEMKDR
jgi:hypothetical protein